MYIVKGNKILEISTKDWEALRNNYEKIIIDLGTGDGRFIFKNALQNPNILYVGIDPSQKQLEIFSKKANKEKLKNILFVIGSIEIFPTEMLCSADKIFVILPWGSLLQKIVSAPKVCANIFNNILKPQGEIEIVFGYYHLSDPSEVERLELPILDQEFVKNNIINVFEKNNFKLIQFSILEKKDLGEFESSWSKRLEFGKIRPIYRVILKSQI